MARQRNWEQVIELRKVIDDAFCPWLTSPEGRKYKAVAKKAGLENVEQESRVHFMTFDSPAEFKKWIAMSDAEKSLAVLATIGRNQQDRDKQFKEWQKSLAKMLKKNEGKTFVHPDQGNTHFQVRQEIDLKTKVVTTFTTVNGKTTKTTKEKKSNSVELGKRSQRLYEDYLNNQNQNEGLKTMKQQELIAAPKKETKKAVAVKVEPQIEKISGIPAIKIDMKKVELYRKHMNKTEQRTFDKLPNNEKKSWLELFVADKGATLFMSKDQLSKSLDKTMQFVDNLTA